MCGIVAASSNDKLNFSSIKLAMLHADDRGGHSCGIAVRGERPSVIRQVAKAKTFVNDLGDDVQIPRNNQTFIGHTRYATQGAKNTENAHPFIFEDIVGVHNGSIENFKALKDKYLDSYREDVEKWCHRENWKEYLDVKKRKDIDVESDSKLLYYLIWKFGLRKTLPKLKGTLALAFYNTEEDGNEYLYLYRHDKPLCYGYKDDQLWIASMKSYLTALGCINIKKLTEHAIYKIKNGKVVLSKQLPQDIKPTNSTTKHQTDFDPELEPEKKSTTGYRRNYNNSSYYNSGYAYGYQNNNDDEEEEERRTNEDGTHEFVAPDSAKGEKNKYNNLCLYWFSERDYDVVYVEEEGEEEVQHFNLNDTKDLAELDETYPKLSKHILDDFAQIEITYEYRTNPEYND